MEIQFKVWHYIAFALVYTLYLLSTLPVGKEDPESHSVSRGGHREGRATTHISPKISFWNSQQRKSFERKGFCFSKP